MKMKFWNNLRHYAIYRKIFISNIFLVAFAVIIICVTLFSFFSASTIKEIGEVSKSILSQTSFAYDIIYEQVFNIGNQIVVDNEISRVLFTKERDPIIEYYSQMRLNKIKSAYPFIHNIGIYNGISERYISANIISSEEDIDIANRNLNRNKTKYFEFFPRAVALSDDLETRLPDNVLTFIFYPKYSLSITPKCAIIVDIDEKYIQDIIRGIRNNPDDSIFIINSEGIVLSHINSDFFMNDFSDYGYIGKILHAADDRGCFREELNSQKQLITYVKSSSLDGVFISIMPYEHLLSNIYRIKNITLFVALMVILTGILVSLLLTRRIYNPLETLMKKISSMSTHTNPMFQEGNEFDLIFDVFSSTREKSSSLENRLNMTMPVFKETYMHFLLKKNVRDVNNIPGVRDAPEMLEEIDRQLSSPFYCVVVCKLDRYKQFKDEYITRSKTILRFAVGNTIHELIGREYRNEIIIMGEDEVAILILLEDDLSGEKLILVLNEISNTVERNFSCSLSTGMGDIVLKKEEIHLSYQSAVEYLKYRLFFGYGAIISRQTIKNRFKKNIRYPAFVEKKLIDALKLNNRKETEQEIDNFIAFVNTIPYDYAIPYSSQLLLCVLKYFDRIIDIPKSPDPKNYYTVINKLPQADTIEEISSMIKLICFDICAKLDEKRHSKNIQVIEEIQEYIEAHYDNPNLCLDLLAQMVKLSSGYLGKLFRSIVNISFNDYLNKIRLEKASDLLIHTDDTIPVISEKVGINNFTYFFTLFKKNYGMTPDQFRKQNIKFTSGITIPEED